MIIDEYFWYGPQTPCPYVGVLVEVGGEVEEEVDDGLSVSDTKRFS